MDFLCNWLHRSCSVLLCHSASLEEHTDLASKPAAVLYTACNLHCSWCVHRREPEVRGRSACLSEIGLTACADLTDALVVVFATALGVEGDFACGGLHNKIK